MIAKRSSGESVAQKVFVRSTRAGGAIKVFREQYLRDDIPCGSQACSACATKATPDYRGNLPVPVLSEKPHSDSKRGPHYVVLDTNICLKAIDLLESPHGFEDVIIPHIVLEEVRNRSQAVFTRLRALSTGNGYSQKRFYVFYNEFSEDTYVGRHRDETVNDYNDRAIRSVVKYYNEHLSQFGIQSVLLTNDKLNRQISEKEGIPAVSLRDYVKEIGNKSLMDYVATSSIEDDEDEDTKSSKSGKKESVYPPHYSTPRVLAGLQAGTMHQGKFSVSRYNYLEGTVSASGFTYPLLVIGRDMMNRAFDGDKVVVEVLPKKEWRRPLVEMAEETNTATLGEEDDDEESVVTEKERKILADDAKQQQPSQLQPTCRVVAIAKRNWRFYVGNIVNDSVTNPAARDTGALRSILVKPMDNRIPRIRIKTRRANELSQQRIIVAVDDWNVYSRSPDGHFIRALGEIENQQAETEAILLEHDIEYRPFPQAAMDCLPKDGDKWLPDHSAPKRKDLRHLTICSIDPPKCQDIDDALHAHELPNGNLSVGVHIADVTNFVKPDTALDMEGRYRATSTYLVDRRIDMLPSLLGTNLCSLRPHVERYAFSVLWEMTPDGEIINTEYTKSLIKSKQAFEYTEAQAKIDDESQQDELAKSMRILLRISKILKQKRIDAGALNLASPEVKVMLGDNELNDPGSVEIKKPVATNSLVEEFMLLANISVARKIYEFTPQTALLRRHAAPPSTNFDTLNDQLKLKGFEPIKLDSSRAVADSLDRLSDPKDPFFNTLIRIMATRCMRPAEYFPAGDFAYPEFRHYGLASEIYTHFTSPIRRYADVVVHRQLAGAIDYENLPPSHFLKDNLDGIADNINVRHRNAQFAGRASIEYFVGQMLKKQQTTQSLEGYVVKVFSNGFGVLVPKYGLESVVHLEDVCEVVERDSQFDEENYKLTVKCKDGKERTVSIFEKVQVLVESVKNESTGKRFVRMTLG